MPQRDTAEATTSCGVSMLIYHDAVVADVAACDPDILNAKRIEQLYTVMRRAGLIGRRIAHLKGFASGIKMDDHFDQICSSLIRKLREDEFEVLIWDGDSYASDSFTHALLRIHVQLPDLKLVAVLPSCDKDSRFHDSWSRKLPQLSCFLLDDLVSFQDLGVLALRASGAKCVFLLGGGRVARHEFEVAPAETSWLLFDVVRVQNGCVVHSDLLNVKGVQVVSPS